jgi:hypothetical protein
MGAANFLGLSDWMASNGISGQGSFYNFCKILNILEVICRGIYFPKDNKLAKINSVLQWPQPRHNRISFHSSFESESISILMMGKFS